MLRKINTIIAVALILIFMIHGVMGSFMMLQIGHSAGKFLATIGLGLIVVHLVIGVILTVDTIKAQRRPDGEAYARENALFWTRRISGLCILVLAFFHFGLFGKEEYGQYILFEFTTMRLAVQLLLIASLFVHIFVNIRPLLVSLGVISYKKRRFDIYLIISILLLFMAGATIAYFVSWQFT